MFGSLLRRRLRLLEEGREEWLAGDKVVGLSLCGW
jgi:hypothetical protein